MTRADRCSVEGRWLPFGVPAGDVRLYCLPHAGGSASAYRSWVGRIDGVAVCPLQPPGRESRLKDAPHVRMEPMVAEITDVILSQDTMPYALYGHSLGALIGFEVVREIRRRGGAAPVHFFASGCPAPDYRESTKPVSAMTDAQVVDLLRKLGGTPEWVLADQSVLAMILRPFRADFSVKETYEYQPEPPLSTPITVIAGTDDPRAGIETMADWREQTTAPYRLHTVTGGHFAVLERPEVTHKIIAEALAMTAAAGPQTTSPRYGGAR